MDNDKTTVLMDATTLLEFYIHNTRFWGRSGEG